MNKNAELAEKISHYSKIGLTVEAIARRTGVSTRTVERYRKHSGTWAGPRKKITPEEISRAKEMLEEGINYSEVARTLGRSARAIRAHLPGYSWPLVECSRLGAAVRWNKI